MRLLLGEESVLRRFAHAFLGVALEALEKRDFLDGGQRLLQGIVDVLGQHRAIRRTQEFGLRVDQFAQRFGRRLQPRVGPVIPIGRVRGPDLPRRRNGAAAKDDTRPLGFLGDHGDMGERMARRVGDANLPAFPGECCAIGERIIDAVKAGGHDEIGGARAAQRDGIAPVFFDRLRSEPFLGFLRGEDCRSLGQLAEPRADAAVIVGQQHAIDAAHAMRGQIAGLKRSIDQKRLVAGQERIARDRPRRAQDARRDFGPARFRLVRPGSPQPADQRHRADADGDEHDFRTHGAPHMYNDRRLADEANRRHSMRRSRQARESARR